MCRIAGAELLLKKKKWKHSKVDSHMNFEQKKKVSQIWGPARVAMPLCSLLLGIAAHMYLDLERLFDTDPPH